MAQLLQLSMLEIHRYPDKCVGANDNTVAGIALNLAQGKSILEILTLDASAGFATVIAADWNCVNKTMPESDTSKSRT